MRLINSIRIFSISDQCIFNNFAQGNISLHIFLWNAGLYLIFYYMKEVILFEQYFDCVYRQPGVQHAMRRSNISQLFFIWAHPFLAYCKLVTTVGLVVMYIDVENGDKTNKYFRQLLSIGSFIQVLLMIFMRMLHKGVRYNLSVPSRVLFTTARICIAFGHYSIYFIESPEYDQITFHAALSLLSNILDVYVGMGKNNGRDTEFNSAHYVVQQKEAQKSPMSELQSNVSVDQGQAK